MGHYLNNTAVHKLLRLEDCHFYPRFILVWSLGLAEMKAHLEVCGASVRAKVGIVHCMEALEEPICFLGFEDKVGWWVTLTLERDDICGSWWKYAANDCSQWTILLQLWRFLRYRNIGSRTTWHLIELSLGICSPSKFTCQAPLLTSEGLNLLVWALWASISWVKCKLQHACNFLLQYGAGNPKFGTKRLHYKDLAGTS